jgi:hypothetical protein
MMAPAYESSLKAKGKGETAVSEAPVSKTQYDPTRKCSIATVKRGTKIIMNAGFMATMSSKGVSFPISRVKNLGKVAARCTKMSLTPTNTVLRATSLQNFDSLKVCFTIFLMFFCGVGCAGDTCSTRSSSLESAIGASLTNSARRKVEPPEITATQTTRRHNEISAVLGETQCNIGNKYPDFEFLTAFTKICAIKAEPFITT